MMCLFRNPWIAVSLPRLPWGVVVLFLVLANQISAADGEADYVPKAGEFPPPGAGVYHAGELVAVDHVNRRGALRFVGDNDSGRYHSAPSHHFAMLPYGTIRYHGAPAELRDIPIGTVLHGYFVLPPEGDTSVPPPPDKVKAKYVSKYTHAISLEDDFSYYAGRGQSWEIVKIDSEEGQIQMRAKGRDSGDGLLGEKTFEFDASTRIWQGRKIGMLADLAVGQNVQVNLTWSPRWWAEQFHLADVWLDAESREVAAEMQRQVHIRHMRSRWLPGWVDHVEHQQPAGRGIVTVTLFGGMDPELYDFARQLAHSGGVAEIAAAQSTLRTWWQGHDSKSGPIVELKDTADPPTGSSGLQFRVQISELLEGYRPGRIIRFKPEGFPGGKLPPEERLHGLNDR